MILELRFCGTFALRMEITLQLLFFAPPSHYILLRQNYVVNWFNKFTIINDVRISLSFGTFDNDVMKWFF